MVKLAIIYATSMAGMIGNTMLIHLVHYASMAVDLVITYITSYRILHNTVHHITSHTTT